MGQRDLQYDKRRQEILNISLELFVKNGYSGTKIKDIAGAANTSIGLLFHYFPSKEAVYEELIKIAIQGLHEMDHYDQSQPMQFLSGIVHELFQSVSKDRSIAQSFILVMNTLDSDNNPPEVQLLIKNNNPIDLFIPIIEKGQKNGDFREGDSRALSLAFCGAIQGIVQAIFRAPQTPLPSSEWVLDILKKGGA